jgi:hypothetical protein
MVHWLASGLSSGVSDLVQGVARPLGGAKNSVGRLPIWRLDSLHRETAM